MSLMCSEEMTVTLAHLIVPLQLLSTSLLLLLLSLLLLLLYLPRAGSGSCGFFVRIGPIRFLAGCRKRRLNQG